MASASSSRSASVATRPTLPFRARATFDRSPMETRQTSSSSERRTAACSLRARNEGVLNSHRVLSVRRRVVGVATVAAAIALTVFVPFGSAAPNDAQPQVTLSPGAVTFPDRPVGTRSEAQAVTLTNTGDAPLAISTFRLNGPDAGDFGLGAMCPVSPDQLQPGASCTIY